MVSYRKATRTLWSGIAFFALALAVVPERSTHAQLLTADPRGALSLADLEVVDLSLPADLPGLFGLTISVEGEPMTLELIPHSVRAPDFEVREVDGGQATVVDPGAVRTFRGSVAEHKGSVVAGGLLEDGLWARILLADGSSFWIEPVAGRVPGYGASAHVVYRGEAVISRGACGIQGVTITPAVPQGGVGCTGSFCITDIACDADVEFFNAHGASTSRVDNRIETVINIVALQFERDVQITYRITTILVRTTEPDPYGSTNPNTLLDQLRAQWNTNHGGIVRDTVHLFTGRELDGNIIGIAFVGVMCSADAYGLSQSDWSTNFASVTDLTAHELGHNWNANHCTCASPDFTMNPSITGANRFRNSGTPNSTADIIAHRDSVTCLVGGLTNDDCKNALEVCPGTYFGTNVLATQDGSTTCGSNANLDVWYSYTPSFTGSATIDTEGSTGLTDTVLSIHSGCPGTTGNELACDDLSGTGFLSTVTLPVTAGETYLIRVTGFGNGAGTFQLNVAGPSCAAPVNDDCPAVIDICPGEYFGTTQAATNDADASCATSNASPDVWYRYTPRFGGLMILDTCGSAYDTMLAVYSGCPATLASELACDDDGGPCGLRSRIELLVNGGTSYWIRVSGFSNAAGPYVLALSGPQCENDDCAFAQAIGVGTVYGSLTGGSSDGASSCGSTLDNPDLYYEFIAPYDGTFFASTCGTHDARGIDTSVDSVLSLHSACPATAANQLACNDDASLVGLVVCGDLDQGIRRDSVVTRPIVAGETMLIRVSHFGVSVPTAFRLNVGVIPENDACAEAFDVSSGGTYSSDLSFATNDGGASCGASATNADVWYTYTASCTGTLRVDTCGTSDLGGVDLGMDTVLSLHTFCPGDATNEVDCNDQWAGSSDNMACTGVDAGGGNDSFVSYAITQGETILIRVSSWASTEAGPFVLNVGIVPSSTNPGSLANGSFAAGSAGWCFLDESGGGFVDYTSGAAVVTGGNNGADDAFTFIEQIFTTYDVETHRVRFDWSYASTNSPNFDQARWDLVDVGTGLSVVAGPLTLTGTNGGSGAVNTAFSGSGVYSLRLGTWTDDGAFGPGVTTFDNVRIECDSAPGPFANGNFTNPTGAPWCFTDESTSGSVDFSGGVAVVTGGNDGNGTVTDSFIAQTFPVAAGTRELSFTWSYSTTNSPGFDSAYYDLIRVSTGLSVVGGPVTLAAASGMSGIETMLFTGGGDFTLVLGVNSTDNFAGAGVATFDNVAINAFVCDPVVLGSCVAVGSSPTLSWTLGDVYTEIRITRNTVLIATVAGTSTSFSDVSLPAGSYGYQVIGVCGAQPAAPATCSVMIGSPPASFRRGECNNDGAFNLADVVWLLGNLFPPPPTAPNPLPCRDACDGNDDGAINLADAVAMLAALFGVPSTPLPPPSVCGVDPTSDSLTCAMYSGCP
ncbi:MAG: M12 family metallo-peptidase [Planctomycetota bacterium]